MTNTDVFKAAVAEWDRSKGQNLDAWLDHAADDIVMKSIGEGEPGMDFTRARRGKDEFRKYLEGHRETIDLRSFDITEYVEEGDRVVGLGTVDLAGRLTGKHCITAVAIFVRFREGKMIEIMEYFDTAKLAEAFTADPSGRG